MWVPTLVSNHLQPTKQGVPYKRTPPAVFLMSCLRASLPQRQSLVSNLLQQRQAEINSPWVTLSPFQVLGGRVSEFTQCPCSVSGGWMEWVGGLCHRYKFCHRYKSSQQSYNCHRMARILWCDLIADFWNHYQSALTTDMSWSFVAKS